MSQWRGGRVVIRRNTVLTLAASIAVACTADLSGPSGPFAHAVAVEIGATVPEEHACPYLRRGILYYLDWPPRPFTLNWAIRVKEQGGDIGGLLSRMSTTLLRADRTVYAQVRDDLPGRAGAFSRNGEYCFEQAVFTQGRAGYPSIARLEATIRYDDGFELRTNAEEPVYPNEIVIVN